MKGIDNFLKSLLVKDFMEMYGLAFFSGTQVGNMKRQNENYESYHLQE